MSQLFKRLLALLSLPQNRWIWLTALTIASTVIARVAFHVEWLNIFIVFIFFAFKELFEFGRRRANGKATWK
ncbi:MAG: hypothetical protein WKF66_13365 [Pedobacter sp.]